MTGKQGGVTMDQQNAGDGKKMLPRLLELSWRISRAAPPMKPFLRFAEQAAALYKGKTRGTKLFFWDFDDALQKVLLGMARSLATSAEIDAACNERWKINLEDLYRRRKSELAELQKTDKAPQFRYSARDEFIFSRLEPGSRLLYVGCGAGKECLGWAQRGYQVIGIDTDEQLVGMANKWAAYLELPFQAVCMDAENIRFPAGSFDGFLLEFYGFQPSLEQALALQRGLAGVLNEKGKGFISAPRKKYASFWYRMSDFGYPGAMSHWLESQSRLDHCFSATDGCEEKLAFGVYIRSHTVDSLSRELAGVFAVQECLVEGYDPRYLISVVKRKGRLAAAAPLATTVAGGDWAEQEYRQIPGMSFTDVLSTIHQICDLLEAHKDSVERFFRADGIPRGKSPIAILDKDLPGIIELLESISGLRPSAT